MSDEKKSTEQKPIKDEQLDKVSGGIMFPKKPTDPRTPHEPVGGKPEPC